MVSSIRLSAWCVSALAVAGTFYRSADVAAQATTPCQPSTVRVGRTQQQVPPDQDIKFGQCLFRSTVDFNQSNPNSPFASCNGCHPNNRTDRGTHPVRIVTASGVFIGNRQVPNLLNVRFNVPLGWDGRHGGVLGDDASIIAAIKSAAIAAINSPVEMGGRIDPNGSGDQAKLAALAAFIMSRSKTTPNPTATPPPALDAETLARIRTGTEVFFGRSASTSGLLQAGLACVSCHPPPFFTDNQIRTNIVNPNAAYDFGFPQPDGTTGPQDPGAGLVTVIDQATGRSAQVGTFKTPSLHRFYPDGEPAFHGGIIGDDGRLASFYERSLGFRLAAGESTGLHYWLVHCPQGAERNPASIPIECGLSGGIPSPAMSLDGPLPNAIVQQPFLAGGWAIDRGAAAGTGVGVDDVHVWAFRVGDGQAFFVAQGKGGGDRADVAGVYGAQYRYSGFTFIVQGLAPGVYDLAVYAHSSVTGTFNQSKVARITVQ